MIISGLRNEVVGSGGSWKGYWTGKSKILFFGETSKIRSGKLYNQVKGSSDYITVAGAAGSETYQAPNTVSYKNADTDYMWFKADGTRRTVTTAQLIGYDLQRTPVKYDDSGPNKIRFIMIIKSGSVLNSVERNRMFKDFILPIMWDNSWNDYGHEKENRPDTEQKLWSGLGAELCTQGVMDSVTGWSTSYTTFTGGKAVINSSIIWTILMSGSNVLISNLKTYRLAVDVSNYISGALRVGVGNVAHAVNGDTINGNGSYVFYITLNDALIPQAAIVTAWDVAPKMSLDNLSIKEVL